MSPKFTDFGMDYTLFYAQAPNDIHTVCKLNDMGTAVSTYASDSIRDAHVHVAAVPAMMATQSIPLFSKRQEQSEI